MNDECRAIVADLAEMSPNVHADENWHSCFFCEASTPVHVSDHAPTCVWRRAKELAPED